MTLLCAISFNRRLENRTILYCSLCQNSYLLDIQFVIFYDYSSIYSCQIVRSHFFIFNQFDIDNITKFHFTDNESHSTQI